MKQPNIQQPNFEASDCPECKLVHWTEFFHGYICRTPYSEFFIIKQKHQIEKKTFVGKITIFLLVCHMLVKGLQKNIILSLIQHIIQQKFRLMNYIV